MLNAYTATYIKIPSGYMGQMVDCPEVITEGETLEECKEMPPLRVQVCNLNQ